MIVGFGDEIMVTGEVRVLRQKLQTSRFVVHPPLGSNQWSRHQEEVFKNNPFIVRPDAAEGNSADIGIDNRAGRRPYIAVFSVDRITFSDYKCAAGELFFDEGEKTMIEQFRREYGECVVIEPRTKRSLVARNRDWNFGDPSRGNWKRLVDHIGDKYKLLQIGRRESRFPDEAIPVRRVHTSTFREACCVIAAVRGVICTEGGLHHAAAALGKPAVVIFGGRTSPSNLGYDTHRNIYVDVPGSPCGRIEDCEHCRRSMELITSETVMGEARLAFQ